MWWYYFLELNTFYKGTDKSKMFTSEPYFSLKCSLFEVLCKYVSKPKIQDACIFYWINHLVLSCSKNWISQRKMQGWMLLYCDLIRTTWHVPSIDSLTLKLNSSSLGPENVIFTQYYPHKTLKLIFLLLYCTLFNYSRLIPNMGCSVK